LLVKDVCPVDKFLEHIDISYIHALPNIGDFLLVAVMGIIPERAGIVVAV
jgi:hypothetical protein